MAWPQNEISLGVSLTGRPIQDLNHWRFSSTRLTRAIGTPNIRFAMRVNRSKRSSDEVSSILSDLRVLSRVSSSGGISGFFNASSCHVIRVRTCWMKINKNSNSFLSKCCIDNTSLLDLRHNKHIVFAIIFCAFWASGIEEVVLPDLLILALNKGLHLLFPFRYVFIGAFKHLGQIIPA